MKPLRLDLDTLPPAGVLELLATLTTIARPGDDRLAVALERSLHRALADTALIDHDEAERFRAAYVVPAARLRSAVCERVQAGARA